MTDWEQTARLFCVGDLDAFRAVVEELEHEAIRFARGLVRDRPIAEELVQEAFLRIWQQRTTLRSSEKFRPWFYRVLSNICNDYMRTRTARERMNETPYDGFSENHPSSITHSLTMGTVPSNDLSTTLIDKEQRDELGGALSRLPERDQTLLALRYGAELSIADLATVLGMRPNTVLSRIHRALRRLRADLDNKSNETPNVRERRKSSSLKETVSRSPPADAREVDRKP